MAGFLGKSDALGGSTAALRVETTGPERSLGLSLREDIGVGSAPASPDGVLTAPAEAVVRLIGGRLGPAHTPDSLSLSGPVDIAQLRRVFPGF